MEPCRVLVVDDSAFMRKIITDLIESSPHFHVIDTAKDGLEAVEKVRTLRPDIITMDVEMPMMNGLQALQIIMERTPTPVIMLSSLTDAGTEETIIALESGAIDFVKKPSGSISLDLHKVKHLLLEKLYMAAKTNVQRVEVAATVQREDAHTFEKSVQPHRTHFEHLIAMGTSTGGPKALQQVLSGIPKDFPAPILIVQHMPPVFTRSLAHRLNGQCAITVVEATDGLEIEPSTAYIAPGGWHMVLERSTSKYRISLNKLPLQSGHRPSVDHLFESLINHPQLQRHLVLMTGMGTDGAKGMKRMKDHGATTTIAQSEQSCVVYGMPRAAVQLQAVDYEIPLEMIANKLIQIVEV